MNIIIYHHNDMDGRVAGALCYYYERHIKQTKEEHITMLEIDYMYEFKERITPQDKVYFVDYSFSKAENIDFLINLLRQSTKVIWIDHHKTSEELIENNLTLNTLLSIKNAKIRINTKYCATYLVYKYLYEEINNASIDYIPLLIRYVDSYDCWKHNMGSTHEFHYGFEYKNLPIKELFSNIKNNRYNQLVDMNIFVPYKEINDPTRAFVNDCIRTGTIISRYVDTRNNIECSFASFEFKIKYFDETFNCIALNIHGNSTVFGDKIDEYDIVVPFVFIGEYFKYSMFTAKEGIDCSSIVRCFDVDNLGAGGHAKAAGFQTKNLILRKDCTIVIKKGLFGRPKLIFK